MCSLFCPMINKFGVCESTLRRVKVNLPAGQREGTLGCERVQECPHNRLRETVSKLNTNRWSGRRCADV